MKLGIIGLPQSGKTTIFNALTRGSQPVGDAVGRMEIHTAVVDVPDPRLERLNEIYHRNKKVHAKVTCLDIAGLGALQEHAEISGPLLNQLAQMDGFIQVVRVFENPSVPHMHGSVDPARDIRLMEEEFLLNDQIKVERKLEKLQEEGAKGGGRDKTVVQREIALFNRLQQVLVEGTLLRDIEMSAEEESIISSFGFLSRKPVLIVLNLGEDQKTQPLDIHHEKTRVMDIRGKLEMEIAQLPPEDARMFMEEYDIEELALDRIIQESYGLLGLQSFFTIGEDEVRAWTVRRGALATEAAGVVHTDMEKGFIKAEVIPYQDFIEAGSMAEARARGKLRLEGKQYKVQDGDILTIRFNL